MYIFSADCIEVKGYQRSAICDLRRQAFYEGPHIEHVNKIDGNYLSFLIENEIIFQVPDEVAQAFKPIDLNFEKYSFITNAVIHYGSHLIKTMEVLEWSLCYDFAIVISKPVNLTQLSEFLKESYKRNFNSIELHFLMNEHIDNSIQKINEFLQEYPYINPYLYTDSEQIINVLNTLKPNRFLLKPLSCFMHKNIGIESFYCNIEFFVESQKHNTYYNRKLFVDSEGNIMNTREGYKFANVFDLNTPEELYAIINSSDFKFLWEVSKDKIDVCKDCEYRHLCIDSRIPTKRDDGTWYHTSECNYNPYICKWRNEEDYLNLRDSGISINKESFNINKVQLNSVIEAIYG